MPSETPPTLIPDAPKPPEPTTSTTVVTTTTPPPVTNPVDSKKPPVLMIVLIVLLILSLLGVAFFAYQNMQLNKQVTSYNDKQVPPTYVSPSPTATALPNPTANWKIYQGTEFTYPNSIYNGYSFMYPTSCLPNDDVPNTNVFKCKTTNGSFILIANAGGHGGEVDETKALKSNETKNIPAGEGKITEIQSLTQNTISGTYWINKTDKFEQSPIFGFEFTNVPVADQTEFETLFDQILSTFKFTNGK